MHEHKHSIYSKAYTEGSDPSYLSKKLFGIFECNSNRYWEGDLIKKVCVQSLKVETIVRYCYGDIITAESGGVGDKKEVRCISPETP